MCATKLALARNREQLDSMIGKLINNRYAITHILSQDSTGSVYGAEDTHQASRPVAIRTLHPNTVSRRIENRIRFKNEALASAQLEHPNIINIIEILENNDDCFLVMEYHPWKNLTELIRENPCLPLTVIVNIMVQITDALAAAHDAGIIHRDLKPAAILITTDTPESSGQPWYRITLINFGLALIREYQDLPDTGFSAGRPVIPDVDAITGTIQYLAPELIGMAPLNPDERSDLYSLGVIFYELAAGRHPFTGDSLISILHQLAARAPVPPTQYNSAIMPVIEQIILKLLRKDPDERYQSARGLLNDLKRFARGATDFTPGLEDRITRLSYRTRLVGRDRELAMLKQGHAATSTGTGGIYLISGPAGIGKTRLCDELRRYIFEQGGIYIAGTCIDAESKIPYRPFVEVVSSYLKQYNQYTDKKKDEIKSAIQKTVGALGGILLKLNSELAVLLNSPNSLVPLEPGPEMHRFIITISGFFYALAQAEGGLMVFLDDLQWSDEGSLALVQELMSRIDTIPLMIIGTYRDTEVNYHHKLKQIILTAREMKSPLMEITLTPFTPDSLREYLALLLHRHTADQTIDGIITTVLNRSQGNPLFARELVRQLAEGRVLYYGEDNHLMFDLHRLETLELPETIVDILLRSFAVFDDEEREILSYAAVIGRNCSLALLFDLFTYERRSDATGEHLHSPAINYTHEEIIAVIDKALSLNLLESDVYKQTVSFSHDAIRTAFYESLDAGRRKGLHAHIAETIEYNCQTAGMTATSTHPALFELAYHYSESGNREKALYYTWPAGLKAKENYAYDDAINYLSWALFFSEEGRDNQSWASINREIGNIYLIIGKNDEAIEVCKALLQGCTSKMEQSFIYKQISQAYFKKGDFQNCEDHSKIGLHLLGERLPDKRIWVIASIIKQLIVLAISHMLPKIVFNRSKSVPNQKFTLLVGYYHSLIWLYVYKDFLKFARSIMRIYVIARNQEESREQGICIATFALLCNILNLYNRSFTYHHKALRLRERLGDEWGIAQSYQMMGYSHLFHGRFAIAILDFEKSADLFNTIGDLKEYGNSLLGIIWCRDMIADYQKVYESIDRYAHIASIVKDDFAFCYVYYLKGNYYLNMADYSQSILNLNAAYELSTKKELWALLCMSCTTLGKWHRERNDFAAARRYFEQAKSIYENYTVIKMGNLFLYWEIADCYIEEYLHTEMQPAHQKLYVKKIKMACGLAMRKTRFSINDYGSALRVNAKYHAIIKNNRKAERLFCKSIAHVKKIDFRIEHGIALFDYGIFLHATGRAREARKKIEESYNLFLETGNRFYIQRPQKFLGIGDQVPAPSIQKILKQIKDAEKRSSIVALIRDMNANLPLDVLLQRALARIVEMTGAGRGFIIFKETKGALHTSASINTNGVPADEFAQRIIGKILTDGESLLANNTEENNTGADLAGIAPYELPSILCVPIRHRTAIVGACYLDNKLSGGIFSKDDVEIVQLSMAQITLALPALPNRPDVDSFGGIEPNDEFCKKYDITKRERELIALIIKDFSRKAISQKLGITYETANDYFKKIYAKIGVHSKLQLIDALMKESKGSTTY